LPFALLDLRDGALPPIIASPNEAALDRGALPKLPFLDKAPVAVTSGCSLLKLFDLVFSAYRCHSDLSFSLSTLLSAKLIPSTMLDKPPGEVGGVIV
jgi:hypothetical protein